MFELFNDLSKGMRSLVDFAGDVVATGVDLVTSVPVIAASVAADAVLGEKNLVSESLETVHNGIRSATEFTINNVAKPVVGAVTTAPIRQLGAAVRVVEGMGQVAFTDNPENGLKNISQGAGTLVVMAVTGAVLSGVAEEIGLTDAVSQA